MAIYNNEEEQKRRRLEKRSFAASAAEGVKKAAANPVYAPVRYAAKGAGEAARFAKAGFKEAAERPTFASRTARGLRTVATIPVAAAYGIMKEPAEKAVSLARKGKQFASEFGTELLGGEYQPPPAAVPVRAGDDMRTAEAPVGLAPAARQFAGQEYPVGTPGTGEITTSSGGVARTGPSDRVTMTGQPLRDLGPEVEETVEGGVRRRVIKGAGEGGADKVILSPVRKFTGRMVEAGGGYRLPEREAKRETPLRMEDIKEPTTIGGVPVYRRRMEARRADMAAEQAERQLHQQQAQFEAGRTQQQEQFATEAGLEARKIAGAEQRQAAELGLRQRQAEAEMRQREQLDEAIGQFTGAETPGDRKKAADMINILSGKGVKTEGRAPAWKPKEISDALGDFEENFRAAQESGQLEEGASFHRMLLTRDPQLYQATYGRMAPQAAEFAERVLSMPTEELMADEKFKAMLEQAGEGTDPEELKARIIAEYRELAGS